MTVATAVRPRLLPALLLLLFAPAVIVVQEVVAQEAATQEAPAQDFLLTLASEPQNRSTISTRSGQTLTLRVSNGETLSFARSRGRDTRLESSGGFFWTQVQEVPRDAETIRLTPSRASDGSVSLAIARTEKRGDRTQSISTTVRSRRDEWTLIYGTLAAGGPGVTSYGTRRGTGESLYVRLSDVGG